MQWIQIIIFVLLLSGFFTLFDIRFTDLLNLLAVGKKSTLNDDIDVLLGKPAKGFFNRESVEIEQLLKSTGRENRFTNNFLSAKRRPDESRKREYPLLKSTCKGKL